MRLINKYFKFVVAVFYLIPYSLQVNDKDFMLNHFKSNLNSSMCSVCFFEGWSTYDHPVKPENPIDYISAIKRGGYYRAWMCESNGRNIFVRFEGVRLNFDDVELISVDSNIEFFGIIDSVDGESSVGVKVDPVETLKLKDFFIKVDGSFIRVEQEVLMKYEYSYKDSGALRKAVITNFLGESNVLEF